MRALAFAMLAAAFAAVPAVAVEPVVVYVDRDEGTFTLGTAVAPAPDVAGANPSTRRYSVAVDQCHRHLAFSLLYQPEGSHVGSGGTGVGLGYAFRVEVRNSLGPVAGVDVLEPGDAHRLGTVPRGGPYTVDVWLKTGADVDWTFTLRGLDVLRFAPTQWEPACARVRINEVEANPAGADAGAEWIELFNEESSPIDLAAWTVEALHGEPAILNLPTGTLLPAGGVLRIPLGQAQFLDNADEEVVLTNAWGLVADRTSLLKDEADDERTNQWIVGSDGSSGWKFLPGTPGGPNPA